MLWSAIGNEWFDSWIKKFLNFNVELSSAAARNALTEEEIKSLTVALEKINKINQRVKKRYDKFLTKSKLK